jgi:hypothetical protein
LLIYPVFVLVFLGRLCGGHPRFVADRARQVRIYRRRW